MKDRDSLAEMVEVKAEPQNQHLMLWHSHEGTKVLWKKHWKTGRKSS
jgi:proteasome lid subunit RPN8/RPN11